MRARDSATQAAAERDRVRHDDRRDPTQSGTADANGEHPAMTDAAAALLPFGTKVLREAGAPPLPSRIQALNAAWRVCGRVFTVALAGGNNIWLHRALYAAGPGDVLVVSTDSPREYGYWGDTLTHAALERELGGLVIDGAVRDSAELCQLGFPIFSRGRCLRGAGKEDSTGSLRGPVALGSAIVSTGDLVVGDEDGVVFTAPDEVATLVRRAATVSRT
ncbi:RraA family protein [Amycolatopsis rhabdoformis]|uniref:Putative 4-hydroxy-4-methyl-2-oxoglutarate aldolase n=1 Tax=Amycolatopsis rhabdoformis TaxID=1448059 RepID=A0ABZ1IER3_9PSEU|nr:RraA family protein [Amycolatopsis rhabdoformis]WSE32231.1 RraA family protein [Amycolatopsis rhabdoformis]